MEPKRTERNLKNIYRLEPLMNRKLYTAITTMLKNTIAGRITTGPANTSDGEMITVLNPQKELTVANAEIK